jgi:hypothetical protein
MSINTVGLQVGPGEIKTSEGVFFVESKSILRLMRSHSTDSEFNGFDSLRFQVDVRLNLFIHGKSPRQKLNHVNCNRA